MSDHPHFPEKRKGRLNVLITGAGRSVLSFAIGLLVALVLDYALYRMGLPSKPFIYVAF
jgi:hypothetical protein